MLINMSFVTNMNIFPTFEKYNLAKIWIDLVISAKANLVLGPIQTWVETKL